MVLEISVMRAAVPVDGTEQSLRQAEACPCCEWRRPPGLRRHRPRCQRELPGRQLHKGPGLGPGAQRRPWPCAQRTAVHNRRPEGKQIGAGPAGRALLEQAAGAEGIVVAGAATPPHEPTETEFEGHAAFLASAVVAALVAGRQECADHHWLSWLSAGPARLAWTSLTSRLASVVQVTAARPSR